MPPPWLGRLAVAGRDLLGGLQQLLYPGCCLLCGQPLQTAQPHFCSDCRHKLFDDPSPSCPRCAATVGPFAVIDGRCHGCREERFRFERALRLGSYDGLLREVVLRLKHASAEGLAELLGEWWAEQAAAQLAALQVEAVVPVPLHWIRRWGRGYNQSGALAGGLAGRLHLPCRFSWLRRIRNTPRQTQQTRAGRKENVRGAFRVPPGVRLDGRSILLVDDVMTTGATVGEASRALVAAGAARVVVAVLARAHG